ncbi:surface polysaccharide O-acyltransferase-like enzyme [Sinobacterium caligoides]|uniref:Surface polysaccharide O-acyltransferase-like enzyme n=1 Tax=Sinobacterium caligoides TaxID=933926 RepID=A0A3N2E0E4_9GAMM|nr:acyltransferase [Sinobacterium caligoides]ROS05566.1 surface polysaccharide O-acyltransferase-like enzyme [Sinobacterium caligoides]
MSEAKPSYFYLNLLRCVATIAVIIIHVLGPMRELYGQIPVSEWLATVTYNSATRWAVPVFMMISGALLLSDKRPFDCRYYLSRRLMKVLIPFLAWTVIYSLITGYSGDGWSSAVAADTLIAANNTPVWYHLWFFYDFIPLYFVIPLLIPVLRVMTREQVKLLIAAWLFLTSIFMLKIETAIAQNIVLYSGYLILGWFLHNRDNSKELKYWVIAGLSWIVIDIIGTWAIAQQTHEYSGFFMGYKTINTVLIGGMIFVLCQHFAPRLEQRFAAPVNTVGKYSLGIYLIHPILLIPVRQLDNGFYAWFGTDWLAISAISVVTLMVALALTWLLAKVPVVNRLLP